MENNINNKSLSEWVLEGKSAAIRVEIKIFKRYLLRSDDFVSKKVHVPAIMVGVFVERLCDVP